jgi:hypothetical protein
MDSPELRVRKQLSTLAGDDRGRALLQLALRGIRSGRHAVTAGCWVDRGVAGCLFQHAYWQGVRECTFPDRGRPGDWIGSLVGSTLYGDVIATIDAFDQLAKERYSDRQRRALRPDRHRIRQDEWRAAVDTMLVDVLAERTTAAGSPAAALTTQEGRS